MKKRVCSYVMTLMILMCGISFAGEYVVQKADTLWGISTEQLNDAFLWPRVWNVNPHITNPDLIQPGTRLYIPSAEELRRMYPAPSEKMEKVKVPDEKPKRRTTVAKKTPPRKYVISKNVFKSLGWITGRTIQTVGEVISMPMGREMVAREDNIYIKLNDEARDKRNFLVARDIKMVTHPVSGLEIGRQIRIVGVIEATGLDDGTLKAAIVQSFEEVEIGDMLLPFVDMIPPSVSDPVRTPDISGYVIETHMNNVMVGEGHVLFLDKGRKHGLLVGDKFSLYSEMDVHRSIGTIQVVSVSNSTAAALILRSIREAEIGYQWGPNKDLIY
ncbi:MAG: LysM peptidoglycan-binding domain-containing protein [Nitrospira sp.]|nr:LysM peptidoglycan-binding domain-containing protein [bacterium]MBL7031733.1 LysM peptidoglycan-binding domain-containing protein [Nitrospira sp.]